MEFLNDIYYGLKYTLSSIFGFTVVNTHSLIFAGRFYLEATDLKKAGLKATLPRIRILQILEDSHERHMSAEDVYKTLLSHGEEVGLATVYRVLTQFETAGLVIRHNFDSGHSVFELDQGAHHDHMVCLNTGKVIEFNNEEIERLQKEIAKEHGYDLVEHSLVLYVKPNE